MTPYQLAHRFVGQKEVVGKGSNPLILGMLQLASTWPSDDSVPWCSAFVWFWAFLYDLPRPPRAVALRARAWLDFGMPILLEEAIVGFDIVVLERGKNPADGHVGFYAGHDDEHVTLLGGNQGDAVTIQAFDRERIVGVRRLA